MSITTGTELRLAARCARPALRLSCLGTETGEEQGEGQEGHPDPSLTPLERPGAGAAIAGDQDSTATLPGAPPRLRAALSRLPGAAGLRSQPRDR